MANTLLTIDMITREALRVAHEQLTFLGTIKRDYDSQFGNEGGKIGASLRIRLPNEAIITRSTRVMNVQHQAEEAVTLTVATQDHADFEFYSDELALSIEDFSQRYIMPHTKRLVSLIESDCLVQATKDTPALVGTAGTIVGASGDITALGLARAKLNQALAPMDQRSAQLDSVTMASISNATKGVFHQGEQITQMFREGYFTRYAMADWYENERTHTHTNGDDVAWAVDDAARLAAYTDAAGLSILNMDAGGTTLVVGSVFTIADLYDVHPETKQPYSHLKQFTVTAAGTVAANNAEFTFSPTIRIAGAKQNCYLASGVIADLEDNVVAMVGLASTAYRQNLMYHKEAYAFVSADLPLVGGAESCVRRNQDGLAMRVWQDGDIVNDRRLMRIDILWGFKSIRPQWGCRITN